MGPVFRLRAIRTKVAPACYLCKSLFSGETFFPGPGGGEGLFDRTLGPPAEFAVGEGRIRPDGGDVSGAARGDPPVQLDSGGFPEGFLDQRENPAFRAWIFRDGTRTEARFREAPAGHAAEKFFEARQRDSALYGGARQFRVVIWLIRRGTCNPNMPCGHL